VIEQAGMSNDNHMLDAKDFTAILPNVKSKLAPVAATDLVIDTANGQTLAQVVADAEKRLIEAALRSARYCAKRWG
jgi:hypothetical protein